MATQITSSVVTGFEMVSRVRLGHRRVDQLVTAAMAVQIKDSVSMRKFHMPTLGRR